MEELQELYEAFKEIMRQGKEGIIDMFKSPFLKKIQLRYEETLEEGKQGIKDYTLFFKKKAVAFYKAFCEYVKVGINNSNRRLSVRLSECVNTAIGSDKELKNIQGGTYSAFNFLLDKYFPFSEFKRYSHDYILSYDMNEGIYITEYILDLEHFGNFLPIGETQFIPFSNIVYINKDFIRLDILTRDNRNFVFDIGFMDRLFDAQYNEDYKYIMSHLKTLSKELKKADKENRLL